MFIIKECRDQKITFNVRRNYEHRFLKEYINSIENSQEIIDEMIEYYSTGYLSAPLYIDHEHKNHIIHELKSILGVDFYWKTFFLIPSKLEFTYSMSIPESEYMIMEGKTGYHLWEASLAMSSFIFENEKLFKNKRILELGSGLGLPGLVSSAIGAKKVYLTDIDEQACALLSSIIKANEERINNIRKEYTYDQPCKIKAKILNWSEFKLENTSIKNMDIIIASDVIYDTGLSSLFVQVISQFKKQVNFPKIYICLYKRNQSTLEAFFSALGNNLKFAFELDDGVIRKRTYNN